MMPSPFIKLRQGLLLQSALRHATTTNNNQRRPFSNFVKGQKPKPWSFNKLSKRGPRDGMYVHDYELKEAIDKALAPPSVEEVPFGGGYPSDEQFRDMPALVRDIGACRRVKIYKPYMTTGQIEAIAYRIRAMTRNDGLNSFIIANYDGKWEWNEDPQARTLPTYINEELELSDVKHEGIFKELEARLPPFPHYKFLFASGYSPLLFYTSKDSQNALKVDALMASLSKLSLACLGHAKSTRIPGILIPHGDVIDSGFAYLLNSYVCATEQTTFQFTNPYKGLSFDPVGMSYVFPRLGQEFDQSSQNVPVGMILGLTSFKAKYQDMMETGLATNYVETPTRVGFLEKRLALTKPWEQQEFIRPPRNYAGDEDKDKEDPMKQFRHNHVADHVCGVSEYTASQREFFFQSKGKSTAAAEWAGEDIIMADPSVTIGLPQIWHQRTSHLEDCAIVFQDIFENESSLVGIVERLKEYAAAKTSTLNDTLFTNQEEKEHVEECIEVATEFARKMEEQSPLALSVVYRLLQEGKHVKETIHSCMEREARVQRNLLLNHSHDYETWAEHAKKTAKRDRDGWLDMRTVPRFEGGWKHKSLSDVSNDEVEELFR